MEKRYALTEAWTPSVREEVLFVLYAILAVVCFANDHNIFGWFALVKAGTCLAAAIYLAFKEVQK
jgi:hypothetical protein